MADNPQEPALIAAAPAVETPVTVAPDPPRASPYRRRILIMSACLIVIVSIWIGAGYVFAFTDDAFLTSDLLSIAPQVTGPIASVDVQDNQMVAAGAPLFTIDPTPYKYELDRATADAAQASSQLPIDQTLLESANDAQAGALAQLRLAESDLTRATTLNHAGFASVQALEEAQTTEQRATDRLRAAQSAVIAAQQTLRLHEIALGAAEANRLIATWRLARTKIVAPVAGRVAHLTLRVGDMADASTPMIALIAADGWRVIANYKESVLRHLHPGAVAWVWLDTQPWRFFRARVQGIAPGVRRTQEDPGLLPYVSPTIDWIRLARRLPVRFTLDNPPPEDQRFMGSDARVFILF
jgi:multidrug resistance efflux pump